MFAALRTSILRQSPCSTWKAADLISGMAYNGAPHTDARASAVLHRVPLARAGERGR